jgi:hypothetical protein
MVVMTTTPRLAALALLALAACGSDDSVREPEEAASAPAIEATVEEAAEDKEQAEEVAERRDAAEKRRESLAKEGTPRQ